jgi:hypothetical protein
MGHAATKYISFALNRLSTIAPKVGLDRFRAAAQAFATNCQLTEEIRWRHTSAHFL